MCFEIAIEKRLFYHILQVKKNVSSNVLVLLVHGGLVKLVNDGLVQLVQC